MFDKIFRVIHTALSSCMHVDLPLDNKTVWAPGPLGHRAVMGHGLRLAFSKTPFLDS